MFEKVGECLYKLASTGNFYARVWIRGKEIRRSLQTTDWQLAKRRLRDLRKDLEKLDNDSAHVTLKASDVLRWLKPQRERYATSSCFGLFADLIL